MISVTVSGKTTLVIGFSGAVLKRESTLVTVFPLSVSGTVRTPSLAIIVQFELSAFEAYLSDTVPSSSSVVTK